MAQAAGTQGTKYDKVKKKINKLGDLIFKLLDYKNVDSAEELKKFCENIKEIYDHYNKYCNIVIDLRIPRKPKIKLRQYLAQCFMKANSIGIFTKFLNKMTSEILEYKGNAGYASTFDCIKNILNILMYNADADLNFAKKICEEDDLLKFFYNILDVFANTVHDYNYSRDDTYYVVERIVAILSKTLIYESKDNIMKMKQHKFVHMMKGFVNSDSEDLQVMALFFTSYLVDDTGVDLTAAEHKLVHNIVYLLDKSLKEKELYSAEQLAKGILQLSRNDHGKLWLVHYGILDVLHQVLDKDSIEIQKTYLLILWSLAFYDYGTKKKIKEKFLEKIENMRNNLGTSVDEETDTAEFLSHFKDIIDMESESGSGIEELCRTLDNVLWVLKNEDEPSLTKRIMISYCHEDEEVVKRISNELKKNKEYEVWIDFENKGGETMEAKALAVKQAEAVIICGSYGYQRSEICRQEITYARKLKKCLVPLIVKKDFTPTGWLWEGLTGLPRFDMSGKCDFKTSMSKLKDHLDGQKFNRFTEICSSCHERELNCELEGGHKFCFTCGMKLLNCPICNAESTNPKYFTMIDE